MWPAPWGTGRVSATHPSGMSARFRRNMFTATEIPLAVCFLSGLLLQESASWKAHKKPSWAQKELLWEEKTEDDNARRVWPKPVEQT